MTQTKQTGHILGLGVAVSTLVFLLPAWLVTPLETTPPAQDSDVVLTQALEIPVASVSTAVDLDNTLTIRVLEGDTVVDMTLGDYLIGVVSAEMPASFELEALKAQACAARTYTIYQMQVQGNHLDCDVCTDSGCCQAYLDDATAAANWGTMAETYASRIRSAVEATNGQTIDYDGAPILAVFHASSASQTRQAGDVWLSDLPYLQSVSSPETADTVPNYETEVTFALTDLQRTLETTFPQGDFSTSPDTWFQNPVTEEGGTVNTVQVGGETVQGTTLRSVLGLRSACFSWTLVGEEMVFHVTGYGHGVGLSQYGANTMALDGADYLEILQHYYTGVSVDTTYVAAMAVG